MTRRSNQQKMLRHTLRGVESAEPGRSWPLRLIQRGLGSRSRAELAPAKASASVLLISPQNRILLLQRVSHSSSFKSAHVFPGGHVDDQDGSLPPATDLQYHEDSAAYRMAAVRECFEESGILLALPKNDPKRLVQLTEQQKDEGRKLVHAGKTPFQAWLDDHGAVADTAGLIPFTRWLTPPKIPKRYSTQMYIYMLPLEESESMSGEGQAQDTYIPTPDGGVEHTTAQFLYPQEWIEMSLRKEIILFPPQFILLSLVADFLQSGPSATSAPSTNLLLEQRTLLRDWIKSDGTPSWADKCISPDMLTTSGDQYAIMGLEKPGPELQCTQRKGDYERVVKVVNDTNDDGGKGAPRAVELGWRRDLLNKSRKTAKM